MMASGYLRTLKILQVFLDFLEFQCIENSNERSREISNWLF